MFRNNYYGNLYINCVNKMCQYLDEKGNYDSENKAGASGELKEEMDILQQIMEAKLRSNDVYTKSSICQYSLIIAATNEAGCDVVKRRLVTSYNSKKQHKNISLTIESKEIW